MFEINLVPDVKTRMIKAMKLQNLIMFVCIVVTAASVAIVAVLWTFKGGQDLTMRDQDNVIQAMSEKIASYGDAKTLLTIQSQLNGIDQLISSRTVMSRVFDVLNVLKPSNGDTIQYSELDFDLDQSTLTFEAQVIAGPTSQNNFNALNAFEKSMEQMYYDYGRYVDEEGNEIPTRCVTEEQDGANITAIWTKGLDGCHAGEEKIPEDTVVTIVRTPNVTLAQNGKVQLTDWYSRGLASLDGSISGVPHFDSKCITYVGIELDNVLNWTPSYNCPLVSEIKVSEAVDAKSDSGQMVGVFNAVITLDIDAFSFQNKHVLAIGPTGRMNVTDSYQQFQDLFTQSLTDEDGKLKPDAVVTKADTGVKKEGE